MNLNLESPSFQDRSTIPGPHTADGRDLSPELRWTAAPPGTREWVLIVDDPDAPAPQPWVHWLLYNISPECTALPGALAAVREPSQPAGARHGLNSWGTIGYRGPAPPAGHGEHRYHFRIHALDTLLKLPPAVDGGKLRQAMQGHVLEEGLLIGTYQR